MGIGNTRYRFSYILLSLFRASLIKDNDLKNTVQNSANIINKTFGLKQTVPTVGVSINKKQIV
jgi:hypothetical protein